MNERRVRVFTILGILLTAAAAVTVIWVPAVPLVLRVVIGGFAFFVLLVIVIFLIADRVSRRYISLILWATEYRWDEDQGALFFGNIRNVLVRVQTFRRVLQDLLEEVPEDKRDEALHHAGARIGREFALDLENQVLAPPRRKAWYWPKSGADFPRTLRLEKDVLDVWRRYDGRAGFGWLDFDGLHGLEEEPPRPHGVVVLKNCFITIEPTPEDEPFRLCRFMEGYVEGFLDQAASDAEVTVRSVCPASGHHDCRFEVTSAAGSRGGEDGAGERGLSEPRQWWRRESERRPRNVLRETLGA